MRPLELVGCGWGRHNQIIWFHNLRRFDSFSQQSIFLRWEAMAVGQWKGELVVGENFHDRFPDSLICSQALLPPMRATADHTAGKLAAPG